ncbi:unnamed protein product [Prunus armeniaca]|uniref:Uncharacterized protein n=1 Tax=Prunus armeniaca TaxID=36596 RepID=A0A6J5WEY0_PRUAR|nr:unnamed protein product [Prunus armeniaca]
MATSATHEKVHHAGVPVYPNDIEQRNVKSQKKAILTTSREPVWEPTMDCCRGMQHGKLEIGEFVAVYTQLDVETAQIKRENNNITNEKETAKAKEKLPSPFQESVASAFSFLVGGLVPLMAAAFITNYMVMVIAVVAVSSLQLVV